MVKSQNELPHLSPLWSPLLPVLVSYASSLCIEQLYGHGNKSDYQSKQMHRIKKKYTSLFSDPVFS